MLHFVSQEVGVAIVPEEDGESSSSDFTEINDTSDLEYLVDLLDEQA